jgi:serine/threonine-protein kinase
VDVSSIGAGTVIAGKYRLDKLLAKGGMGAVWVAHHTRLDVVIAIKFIETGDAASDEARVRFDREAKVLAKLKSPHIVHVSDYGLEDGVPYLAMELLSGEDLEAKLQREGRFSPANTSILLNQISRGLRVAHDAGLVHRDMKPGNIFLARDDDNAVVAKILDFGIAKAVAPGVTKDATQTGAIIGSPRYMSPEQVRNAKRVDHRSDLWSLAVILFRCVTGRVPFAANEIAVLILEICAEPIPAPSSIDPALGPAMDRFFARALARNPDDRFQSARELADAFAAAAGGISASMPLPPAPRASQPAVAGASTQSVSISELPTLVRGSAPSAKAASVTGTTSDGVLLSGTTGARPRSGGGAWLALIALASALVGIGIAAMFFVRSGSGSTAAQQAPSAAPSVTLPAPTGSPAALAPAPFQSPEAQGSGAPSAVAPPSASRAAAAPPAPTASSRPTVETKRKPVTGGSDDQNPPLGF